jgi:superfamily II DNA or RNA helicase
MIGATGRLVLNITTNKLIDAGMLAKPILFMIDNYADESLMSAEVNDWHAISKYRLESLSRTSLICECANMFMKNRRKVLILVRTKRHAKLILKLLYEKYNILSDVRASYGGNYFEYYDGTNYISDNDNVFKRFENNEFMILIGTSHLFEGSDIPNLDALILGIGGKGERQQIQGIGRVMRRTKTGKYAWLIDFHDNDDIVLSKHSNYRIETYKNIIGIDNSNMYLHMDIEKLKDIFSDVEFNN